MSLLMDALKKAELAKRQGQSEGTNAAARQRDLDGLTLEPLPDANASHPAGPIASEQSTIANLPHLPTHLEELDAQFLVDTTQAASSRTKAPPPSPLPSAAQEDRLDLPPAANPPPRGAAPAKARPSPPSQSAPQTQSAAQNLFAAKHGDKPPSRQTFAIVVGVFTVLAVGGIGGYFWWQLQPKSALVASRTPPPAATSSPIAPSAAVPSAPTFAAPPQVAVAGKSSPGQATIPEPDDKDEDSATAPMKPKAATRRPASAPTAPAATTEAESPIRLTKAPLKVNPALLHGFDAFNRGELAVAQLEYERAQKADPRNSDALHGLAAIAVRQGRLDQAEGLYRRIAEADPQDTVAVATLINMRGQIDPNLAESRLKTLSAAQPELAAPHFSLGNLYARDARWVEAQQAYFRAYSAEPDNPDILYNLAISLEHLRQNKLAAQYYSQALSAAQNRPAGFDKALATARLRTLQP